MNKLNRQIKIIILVLVASCSMISCQKEDDSFTNPYAGGREPLGISFSTDPPSPEAGVAGTEVTFKVSGLLPYKDSLTFYFNNETADVVAIDSNHIKVKVPESASTGIASLVVGDQIFFGPVFHVNGKIKIDNNFKATPGANNAVRDALQLPGGRLLFVGAFDDFNHLGTVEPLNRIVLTSKDGEVVRTLKSRKAVDGGYLNSIASLPDGRLIIGGGFSTYDTHRGEIHNLTVLNKDASLDTTVIKTFLKLDTVPAFNGGVDGNISELFVHGNTITAVGGFTWYLQYVYGKSDYRKERDSLITDSIQVRNVIRFFADGSLDSSFNYDYELHRSKKGPNGPIYDAYMQEDGKLIIVGNFTEYNGERVNFIARLDQYGDIDRSFKVGNGADHPISSITYNEGTEQYLLAGSFRHFNGSGKNGLVLLNKDGSTDQTFNPSTMASNASYRFAKQLSNGLIIVNGFFRNYEGVHRGNFMVLNEEGHLAEGYNTTGDFYGTITGALETKSTAGETLVMLYGGFNKFDEQTLGNVTRLVFTK